MFISINLLFIVNPWNNLIDSAICFDSTCFFVYIYLPLFALCNKSISPNPRTCHIIFGIARPELTHRANLSHFSKCLSLCLSILVACRRLHYVLGVSNCSFCSLHLQGLLRNLSSSMKPKQTLCLQQNACYSWSCNRPQPASYSCKLMLAHFSLLCMLI